jgi:hypothetical protein
MSTTLRSIIEGFSPDDRKLIQSKSRQLAQQMVRHADSPAEVRNALVMTQDEVARGSTSVRKPPARAAHKSKS